MFWFVILTIIFIIFILFMFSHIFSYRPKPEINIQEIEKREDFETENEYLKNFIPIYEESDSNFFLFSGAAGTGKSTFIKEFVRYLDYFKNTHQITSTTGTSVVDFEDGMTINSFAGIGIDKDIDSLNKIITSRKFKFELKDKLAKTDVLIIDEISMFWYHQFDLLNEVLKHARDSEEYFGGIKLLLFGDFLQIPPIVEPKDRKYFDFSQSYIPWVFESKIWEKMDFIYLKLNTHYRQKDKKFIEQLDRLRSGLKIDINYFNSFKNPLAKNFLKLRARNDDVDKINSHYLNKNPNKEFKFYPKLYCEDEELYKSDIKDLNKKYGNVLLLKKGAKVIHLKNDLDNGLVNRSTGYVLKIGKKKIAVRWDAGFDSEIIRVESKKFDKYGDEVLCYSQFPIKLAYSITIHKSQGMTLDDYDIDAKGMFADGQAYVALSRGRDPKKLIYLIFHKL